MLPVLAVVAAAVLFGTTGTAQALGPAAATPLGVGAVRIVVGGLALALVGAVAARARPRPVPPASPRALVLASLAGVCLFAYQPLFFLGVSSGGVAVGTVIALGSAPVLTGLLEWALTRRPPGLLWLAATALATTGVAVLAMGGADGPRDALGVVASVGAGASFAVFAVAQRRLLQDGWPPTTVMGAAGVVSAVLGGALLPGQDLSWLRQPSGIVLALWLGLAATALAYTAFGWGLGGLTAAAAATLTLAEPLTAAVLGVAVLGERIPPAGIAGVVLLAAGLLLLVRGARRPAHPALSL